MPRERREWRTGAYFIAFCYSAQIFIFNSSNRLLKCCGRKREVLTEGCDRGAFQSIFVTRVDELFGVRPPFTGGAGPDSRRYIARLVHAPGWHTRI